MIAMNLREAMMEMERERREHEAHTTTEAQRQARDRAYQQAVNDYQSAWSAYQQWDHEGRPRYGFDPMPPFAGAAYRFTVTDIPSWAKTLQLAWPTTRALAESSWRKLAQSAHPDHGGSNEQMAKLNVAIAEARKHLK